MREIKFKVYDKQVKRIMGQEEFDFLSLHRFLNNEDFIIMQYTGLKDKNGKELYYDSDLIKLPGSDKVWMAIKDRFDIPVFMADQGITIVDFRDYFMERSVDAFEIIGTKQENPELLGSPTRRDR
jgi:hypothetical protein